VPDETSQLMALEPDLVDLSRVTEPLAREDPRRFCGGLNTDNVGKASREWGEEIVGSQVTSLREQVAELLGGERGQSQRAHARTHREMYDRWPSFVEAHDKFKDAEWAGPIHLEDMV